MMMQGEEHVPERIIESSRTIAMHLPAGNAREGRRHQGSQSENIVRRGGPNWQAGLALMRQLGEETGIPVEVYGPMDSMTAICQKAIDFVEQPRQSIAAH